MSKTLALSLLMLMNSSFAGVIVFDDGPVKEAQEIYDTDKKTQKKSSHQGWIHDFEKDQLGKEMEHLAKAKIFNSK